MSDTQFTSGTGGIPTGASSTTPTTGTSADTSSSASSAAQEARQAASDVAGGAKERVGEVAQEAGRRAQDLMGQARSGVTSQAGAQKDRLAGGLRHLGSELGEMGRATGDPGYASDFAQRGEDAVNRVADWFEQREPADVLREVQDFARSRPGTFLAIAAGAGLVVGRMLRGARDAGSNGSGTSGASLPPAGTVTGAPTGMTGLPSDAATETSTMAGRPTGTPSTDMPPTVPPPSYPSTGVPSTGSTTGGAGYVSGS